ncbi:type II toxin-antitoxin system HicA family toxin [Plectonema radiosum]|uniref:type II toxin-antitoxin system HicA family toxin n=1 Tax=Plectonema radiosum TaxID=945768 RepID=UPI0035C935CC
MGRLAGFSYRQIIKIIKSFGFVFYRQAAGSHEMWFNPETNPGLTQNSLSSSFLCELCVLCGSFFHDFA